MPFDPEFQSMPKPVIRSEFSGDPDMREIIEMFVSEMPDRIRQLETSWVTGQFDAIKCVAHQLKGASGGYGFSTVGSAAGNLENSLKALVEKTEDTQLANVKSQLDSLIELCRRISSN